MPPRFGVSAAPEFAALMPNAMAASAVHTAFLRMLFITSSSLKKSSTPRRSSRSLEFHGNSKHWLHARAGPPMPWLQFPQLRYFLPAAIDRKRAARIEHAAARRIDRTRYFALHDVAGTQFLDIRIRDRHGLEQRPGVGMQRIGEQLVGIGEFHQPPEVH